MSSPSWQMSVAKKNSPRANTSFTRANPGTVFDRSERSTDAISNGGTTTFTISRTDFEILLDLNREVVFKVLWACVRVLSFRLRNTNDSLRSFLAMSMF